MVRTTLLSKTGQMNMGGYFKEKTARLEHISGGKYCFYVYYVILTNVIHQLMKQLQDSTKKRIG